MMKFPKGGLLGRAADLAVYMARAQVSVHASYAGYFLILALFPTLMLLLSLLRYTGMSADMLSDALDGVIPAALMPSARRLIRSAYQNASGAVVSVSALAALWSASRGIYGLLTGLNSIYEVREDRGYIYTRLVSMLYTFLFLLMLLLTLVLSVFGTTIVQVLPGTRLLRFLSEVVDLRFLLLLLLQTALFSAMFVALPNCRNTLRQSLPGAVLASVGWLIFSDLYSVYVEHFSRYANIFGSVYGVALSMLWLYCCICIVFYGGVLNRYLLTRKK